MKAFLSELIAIQLVLSQADGNGELAETPVLGTFPSRFLSNIKVNIADRDIESLLSLRYQYVQFNDFDFVFYYLLDNDLIEDAMAPLAKFSITIAYHLDFNQLLTSVLNNPSPLLRQSIAQLWLLSQDIYGFGGIYENTRSN